jgi:hypothetical protein
MNCPHCQTELPEDFADESCPACGRALPTHIEPKASDIVAEEKAMYWGIFWLAFIGAPIICLIALLLRVGPVFLFLPLIGAIIAGFSLAKVYTKTPTSFVVTGILYTLAVLIIYVGILFVGCLVVLSHSNI